MVTDTKAKGKGKGKNVNGSKTSSNNPKRRTGSTSTRPPLGRKSTVGGSGEVGLNSSNGSTMGTVNAATAASGGTAVTSGKGKAKRRPTNQMTSSKIITEIYNQPAVTGPRSRRATATNSAGALTAPRGSSRRPTIGAGGRTRSGTGGSVSGRGGKTRRSTLTTGPKRRSSVVPDPVNPYSGRAPILRNDSVDFLAKFESELHRKSSEKKGSKPVPVPLAASGGADDSVTELGNLLDKASIEPTTTTTTTTTTTSSTKSRNKTDKDSTAATTTTDPTGIPPLIPSSTVTAGGTAVDAHAQAVIAEKKAERQALLQEMAQLTSEQTEETSALYDAATDKGTKTLLFGWGRHMKPFFSSHLTKAAMDKHEPNKGKTLKRGSSSVSKGKKGKGKGKKGKKLKRESSTSSTKSPDQLWDEAFSRPTQPVPTMLDPAWLEYHNVVDVSMTQHSTLIVTDSGAVYAMGYYNDGITDPAKCPFLDRPTLVTSLGRKEVTKVRHCPTHTLAVVKGGGLLTWGSNEFGQLGQSDLRPRAQPRPVNTLRNDKVTKVTCTSNFSAVVTKEGHVYTCGTGVEGQLGFGKGKGKSATFKKVEGIASKATAIGCGSNHVAVLTFSGELYTWGSGHYGVLGHGCPGGIYVDSTTTTTTAATASANGSDGADTSKSWGSSGDNKPRARGLTRVQSLAQQNAAQNTVTSTPSQEDVDAALDQATGSDAPSSTAKTNSSQGLPSLRQDSQASTFGLDPRDDGLDGVSTSSDEGDYRVLSIDEQVHRMASYVPKKVHVEREVEQEDGSVKKVVEKFRHIACGTHHMLALASNGGLYAWGLADTGQLGIDVDDIFVPDPTLVSDLAFDDKKSIDHIACGEAHSALHTKNGDVYIWGHNGEWLGLSSHEDVMEPTRHEYLRDGVTRIFCGSNATIAVTLRDRVRTVPAVRTAAVLRTYLHPYTETMRSLFHSFINPLRTSAKLSMPILPRATAKTLFRNFDHLVLHVGQARDDLDDLLAEWGEKAENRAFVRWFFGDVVDAYIPYIEGAKRAHEKTLHKAWDHKFATFCKKQAHSSLHELERMLAVPLRVFTAFYNFFNELTNWMPDEEPSHLKRSKKSISRSTSLVGLDKARNTNSSGQLGRDTSQSELGASTEGLPPSQRAPSRPSSRQSDTTSNVLDKMVKSPSMDVLTAIADAEQERDQQQSMALDDAEIPPYTLVELRGIMAGLKEQCDAVLTKLDGEDGQRVQKETTQAHWVVRSVIRPVLALFGFKALENDYKKWAYPLSAVFVISPLLIVIVASTVSTSAKQNAASSMIGLFFAFSYLLMIKSIYHGRKDPELLEVAKPSTRIRLNVHNLTEIMNMVVEFFQMASFSINRTFPWNNTARQVDVFEATTVPKTEDTFIPLFVLYILGTILWIVVQKIFQKGGKRFPRLYKVYSFILPAFFTGPLYMILLGTAITLLDCTFPADAAPYLDVNNTVECWSGVHVFYAFIGLVGFGLFFPIATLTPYHAHSEFLSPNRDIRYVPLYIMTVQLLKAFLTLVSIFFSSRQWVTMPVTCAVELLLLVITIIVRPSCIESINYTRAALYAATMWSSIVSAIALAIDDTDNLLPTILLLLGWIIVIIVTLVLTRFTSLERKASGAGAAKKAFKPGTSPKKRYSNKGATTSTFDSKKRDSAPPPHSFGK